MNPKASATLEKAREDRRRSHFEKALARLEEAIGKFPKEPSLYTEAIDVAMEAGESLKAIQIFKRSQTQLPEGEAFELWAFVVEKVGAYNDPIVGRFMLDQAIKNGDIASAYAVLERLTDHAAAEVLEHVTTKKRTMSLTAGAKRDVVSYTVAEALLYFRLGRLPEAAESFVSALDDDPGLSKLLAPFLLDADNRHRESGETSYALGWCHIAGGRFPEGVEALVRAARRTPRLAARVIEKLETLGDRENLPPDVRDLSLADLYLDTGDTRRSCALFSAVLERDPRMAPRIADTMKTAVDRLEDDLGAGLLFAEASLIAGRRETGLSHLRKIYGRREHRAPLLEWLQSKSESERLAADVQLFFAQTALSEGLYRKAIDIFEEMLSQGREEHAAIKDLLSRYQSNRAVQQFYTEKFGASPTPQTMSDGAFERYDRHFEAAKLDAHFEEKPSADEPTSEDTGPLAMEHLDSETNGRFTASRRADPGAVPGAEGSTTDAPWEFDNRDFSLSMHAPSDEPPAETASESSSEALEPSTPTETEGSDLFEYLKRDFPADRPSGEGSVSEAMDLPRETFPESAEVEEAGGENAPADEKQGVREDFDSLYREFLRGTLDRGRILDLVEKAFDEDRTNEVERLLAFEPANLGEEIARKVHLARYYLRTDRPVPALVALKSVPLGALSKEERKTLLSLLADCYRRLHNYEAAHAVYLRILSEHPKDADVEAAAKTNYAMYVAAAAGAAPTLEKSTDL